MTKNNVKNQAQEQNVKQEEITMAEQKTAELISKVTENAIKAHGGKLEDLNNDEIRKNENLIPLLCRILAQDVKNAKKSLESQEKKLEELKGKQDSQSRANRTLANSRIDVLKRQIAELESAQVEIDALALKLKLSDTQMSALWGTALCGLQYAYTNAADLHKIAEKLEEKLRDHPATISTIAETGEYKGDVYKSIKSYLQDFYNLCGIRIANKPCYVKQQETAALIHGCVKLICKGDKSLNLTKDSGLQIATAKQIEKVLCKILVLKIEGKLEETKKADADPVGTKQSATEIVK